MKIDEDMDEVDVTIIGPESLKPRIILASYYVLQAPFKPCFGVPGLFFMLVTSGRVGYQSACGAGGEAGAGDLLCFVAGQNRYAVRAGEPVGAYMLNCLPTGEPGRPLRLALPGIGVLPPRQALGGQQARVARLVERCMHALQHQAPGWQLDTSAAWLELLQAAYYQPSGPHQVAPIDAWTTLLQRLHQCEHDPLVSDLAADMGLSVEHFIRRFRGVTGQTPKQYMLRQRLERARHRLRQGDSVKAAALACGFDDPLYFSRRYRQAFGYAPSATPDPGDDDDGAPAVGLPIARHLLAPGVDFDWFRAENYPRGAGA